MMKAYAKSVTNKQVKIEWRLTTILTNVFADMAKPDCDECDGEGIVGYAKGEDCEDLPCQKCFPNSSWEDFIDGDDLYD